MSASSETTVVLPADLHARPAGALVRLVAAFTSTVEIAHNGRNANARSVLAVLGLNARKGSAVQVSAVGDDARAAVDAVAELLRSATE